MTMFRNVFSKQLAAQDSDDVTAEDTKSIVPLGGGVAQSPSAAGGQHLNLPEIKAKPAEPKSEISPPDLGTPPDPEISARAADAHRLMLEQQSRPRPKGGAPASQVVAASEPVAPPSPPVPQAGRRTGGRARTRLLGFDPGVDDAKDIFAETDATPPVAQVFPTGWIVIASGPGQGHFFPLFNGVAMVGRGEDQAIRLDFGDGAISRKNHAAIAYDNEDNKFYLGHGGKSNIMRLNGRPVLATEDLSHGDVIRIGETTLRFVALCDDGFTWADQVNL